MIAMREKVNPSEDREAIGSFGYNDVPYPRNRYDGIRVLISQRDVDFL